MTKTAVPVAVPGATGRVRDVCRGFHPIAVVQGGREMLLYEALARARMREAEEAARRHRIARRLVARRRWSWLAEYAAARAERARRSM